MRPVGDLDVPPSHMFFRVTQPGERPRRPGAVLVKRGPRIESAGARAGDREGEEENAMRRGASESS